MSETVDFNERKKAKRGRCQICGGDLHDFIGQCQRIESITQEADGAETYHLWPLDDVAGTDPV